MKPLKQQKEIWVLGSTGYVGAQLTKLLIQTRHEGGFLGRISTFLFLGITFIRKYTEPLLR
tara:strand:- start:667 stop:849 length:183 start_codon:yes stop_codon:yes gene_type:complete